MPDIHQNFAYSTVATAPSPAASGTSLTVASGDGARFPDPQSNGPYNVTVWPAGARALSSNSEIVRVTARATDTLTIARTQEGTSARTIVVGDQIAVTITAKSLTDIERGRATLAQTNVLAETFPRYLVSAASQTMASQTLLLCAIDLPVGITISSISFYSGSVPGGFNHQIFGIYDDPSGTSSGTGYSLLRGTTDDTTTAWASSTRKTLNLTSSYTTKRSGFYYLGCLLDTGGTTPALACAQTAFNNAGVNAGPVLYGTSNTGATTLPNPASAPTAINQVVYATVS